MEFSTSQLAKQLSVHPNTVRWYEQVGLISPAERLPNNYRRFNYKHYIQLRICRIIYGGSYPGREIRNSANNVLAAIKDWDLTRSLQMANEYRRYIEKEYSIALEMASMLVNHLENNALPNDSVIIDVHTNNAHSDDTRSLDKKRYTRKEAAALLGITTEVLRNWERNDLLHVQRSGRKNEKVYGAKELMRMRVIFILRRNNHSISAIHRSLMCYDEGNKVGAALALNQPVSDPDRVYISAGDHWLEILWNLSLDAQKIIEIIEEIKA